MHKLLAADKCPFELLLIDSCLFVHQLPGKQLHQKRKLSEGSCIENDKKVLTLWVDLS